MPSPPLRAPIFTISAPCSGASVVFDSIARAGGVWHSRAAASFLDGDRGADPACRQWDSHRLTADDLERFEQHPAQRLMATLADREGRTPGDDEVAIRPLATGARLALRIPLLARAFPDAVFVVSFRDPEPTIVEMLIQWRSGQYVISDRLPGWDGQPWSLPLTPGWREMRSRPLEETVVDQWLQITTTMLDDLETLPAGSWALSDLDALLADPSRELQRLCAFLDVPYDQALRTPAEATARMLRARDNETPQTLAGLLERTEPASARWRELLPVVDGQPSGTPAPASERRAAGERRAPGARRAPGERRAAAGTPAGVAPSRGVEPPRGAEPSRGAAPTPAITPSPTGDSPFRSLSTASFVRILKELHSSLLISTYQSGRLICARNQQGLLNTHFRGFDKPMGIAVAPGRFALAGRTEVWDFRDLPAVAAKVEPEGAHDACYLPRNRHITGDALMHELAFAGDELWGVATRLSCLVTFDADSSVVPRWSPPFVKQISAGDNCHLNGLCMVDSKPAYVTALGTGDEPGSWRATKAGGGVLLDVASGEIVCSGLSMPHSPRIHEGRMFVLESGRGEVVSVDLATGSRETVVQLPGFTRGFALRGNYAFVGLSQIRESSTFGGLPLTERLQERVCGVWVIHIGRGRVLGFLRFEDLVQEIFDVALLSHRFPEIAEADSTAVSESFALP